MMGRVRLGWLGVVMVGLAVFGQGPVPLTGQQSTEWAEGVEEIWGGYETWPLITPGDRVLDGARLTGLRAVYVRETGLNAPPLKRQTATFEFEPVFWLGRPAVQAMWTGASDPGTPETPTTYLVVVDVETLRQYREVIISRRGEVIQDTPVDGIRWRNLPADGSEAEEKSLPGDHPVFNQLIVGQLGAVMDFQGGEQFRIAAYRSDRNEVFGRSLRVAGPVTIRDESGREHEVWDLQSLGRRDGWVNHYYTSRQAPYFFGYRLENMVTGERMTDVRLISFDRLDPRTAADDSGSTAEDNGHSRQGRAGAPVEVSRQLHHRFWNGPDAAYVKFSMPYMGIGRLEGRFSKLSATVFYREDRPEATSVTLFLDAASIETGDPARDSILASPAWLDAGQHAKVRFQSRRVVRGENGLDVIGDLTIKGITREATVHMAVPSPVTETSNRLRTTYLNGSLRFDRRDFGMVEETAWVSPVTRMAAPLGTDVQMEVSLQVFSYTPEWLMTAIDAPRPDGSVHPVRRLYDVALEGGMDAALHEWDGMLAANPETPVSTFSNLGWLLALSGRPQDAVKAYAVPLAADPDDLGARFRLADALAMAGEYDRAVEEYRFLIEHFEHNSHLHHLLGLLDADPLTGRPADRRAVGGKGSDHLPEAMR